MQDEQLQNIILQDFALQLAYLDWSILDSARPKLAEDSFSCEGLHVDRQFALAEINHVVTEFVKVRSSAAQFNETYLTDKCLLKYWDFESNSYVGLLRLLTPEDERTRSDSVQAFKEYIKVYETQAVKVADLFERASSQRLLTGDMVNAFRLRWLQLDKFS